MKLVRAVQAKILNLLAEAFPGIVDRSDYTALVEDIGEDLFVANVKYLELHGLIEDGVLRMSLDGTYGFNLGRFKITHRGLDFLADDGGLSAILGTVTVKLHEDTLKQLVADKIEQSDLPPADKGRWLEMLRQLPVESTKLLAMKLVESGLSHAPGALQQVGKLLGFQV